jgi:hypothetical protein
MVSVLQAYRYRTPDGHPQGDVLAAGERLVPLLANLYLNADESGIFQAD